MKTSLGAKVSLLVTVLIISAVSANTYLFTTLHKNSKEKGLIIRGGTLNYSLSKAAEVAMEQENLNLIRTASYIIEAPDIALVQVYTSLWDAVDAFPFEKLKELPDPEAVRHFASSNEPFYVKTRNRYDFYGPIIFKSSEDSRPIVIGYARNVLTSASIKRELGKIVVTNILVSSIITVFAVLAINTLVRRVVIKPVLRLHDSVVKFKDGVMPEQRPNEPDEIGELSREFSLMSSAIKEREERLLESEKRLKNLFERVEHAIFRLDREGNIVESNKSFIELFGNFKKFCSLFQSKTDADEHVQQCLKRAVDERLINHEEKVYDTSGNEHTVLFSLYPDMGASGKIKGYDGYFLDITERIRLEEQLRHSQRMEALGTLTGGISHEFNNILTAIIGFSEMMQDEFGKNHPRRNYIDMINYAAHRGADLTKGLLAYSRRQITDMKPVSIKELLRNMSEFLSGFIGADIRLEITLPSDDVRIMADYHQMEQVFLNLAANARDAMPLGGTLSIELLQNGSDEGFRKAHDLGDSCAHISVKDTGTGMDEDTKNKVFEPFFTTKEVGKGTGLGLSVVYGIIKKHKGHIEVQSARGKGTTFNIYLPSLDKR